MRAFRLTCLLLMLAAPMAAKAQDIVLAADEWCPYNCAADAEKPGFAVDLAKAIFEPLGYTVRYEVMPWSRAIEAARSGEVAGVIGVTRPEAPDLAYPKSILSQSRNGFFVRTDSEWSYTGRDSLDDISLGIIESYGYGDELNDYIAAKRDDMAHVQSVSGNNALVQNIEKLLAGRIGAVIEDENVFRYTMMHWKEAQSSIKESGSAQPTPLYIAFSPEGRNTATLVKLYDAGMARLRASGQLDQYRAAYGLNAEK